MPNTQSAKKELRKSIKLQKKNYRMKTHVKSLAKQLKEAVGAGKKDEALDIAKKLQQATDKAARTHVLHKNKAKRIVSHSAGLLQKAK
jgi:small subunit ribosomal protein S20